MEPQDNGHAPPPADGRRRWLDRKENVDKIVWALYAACAGLFAIDFMVPKHGEGLFQIEHWYGFYGIYGFVACVALVLVAKQLRRILMVREDYYDR